MIKENLTDFSCRIYADPLVESLCRQLQDHYYANINIILWLCWLDKEAVYLHKSALDTGINLIGEITGEIVSLLRQAREQVKNIGGFTRLQEQLIGKNILQAEIAVEKILLERLENITADLAKIEGTETKPLSLSDYLESLHTPEPNVITEHLLTAGRNNPEMIRR